MRSFNLSVFSPGQSTKMAALHAPLLSSRAASVESVFGLPSSSTIVGNVVRVSIDRRPSNPIQSSGRGNRKLRLKSKSAQNRSAAKSILIKLSCALLVGTCVAGLIYSANQVRSSYDKGGRNVSWSLISVLVGASVAILLAFASLLSRRVACVVALCVPHLSTSVSRVIILSVITGLLVPTTLKSVTHNARQISSTLSCIGKIAMNNTIQMIQFLFKSDESMCVEEEKQVLNTPIKETMLHMQHSPVLRDSQLTKAGPQTPFEKLVITAIERDVLPIVENTTAHMASLYRAVMDWLKQGQIVVQYISLAAFLVVPAGASFYLRKELRKRSVAASEIPGASQNQASMQQCKTCRKKCRRRACRRALQRFFPAILHLLFSLGLIVVDLALYYFEEFIQRDGKFESNVRLDIFYGKTASSSFCALLSTGPCLPVPVAPNCFEVLPLVSALYLLVFVALALQHVALGSRPKIIAYYFDDTRPIQAEGLPKAKGPLRVPSWSGRVAATPPAVCANRFWF